MNVQKPRTTNALKPKNIYPQSNTNKANLKQVRVPGNIVQYKPLSQIVNGADYSRVCVINKKLAQENNDLKLRFKRLEKQRNQQRTSNLFMVHNESNAKMKKDILDVLTTVDHLGQKFTEAVKATDHIVKSNRFNISTPETVSSRNEYSFVDEGSADTVSVFETAFFGNNVSFGFRENSTDESNKEN
ncbi:hypothetical protein HDE_02821 [Halotydeus destructor]|nr:hypothetical protein HDE_02821 [Halotydeus destructor]